MTKLFVRGNFSGLLHHGGLLPLILLLALGALPVFAQRPVGVDVSDYQGTINWTSVKNTGVTFAWTKATEGETEYEDTFTNNENNAKTAGVLIGAYHFAHPELHPGTSGAQVEAQHFWNTARNWIKPGGFYLQPMLDVESDLSGSSPAFTKTSLSQWVNDWCNYLVAVANTNGVTINPVIYTYTSYSSTWLNSTVTSRPLWMASYPSSPNPQTGVPTATAPWSTWNFWQYTGSNTVSGYTHGWDADAFNGTATTLNNFVIPGSGPPSFTSAAYLQRAVDTGGKVAFASPAVGTAPLKYQWQLNGVSLANATTNTFTVTNAQMADAGYYSVIVTNASGSVTSPPVSLLVYPAEATVFSDNFDANTATNWIVNRSSTDTAFTFNFDYSALGIPSAPHSTGGTTRGLQMKANLANAAVSALSLSPTNQVFAGDYRIHFDSWINVNGPLPGGPGSTEYLTGGVGTSGTRPEWSGNSSADGAYFSVDGDGGSVDTTTTFADLNVYVGPTVQLATTGDYWAGTDTSARGNLNVYYTTALTNAALAPALQRSNYPQQTGNLDAGTFGLAWHDVIVSKRGSTVDWVVDGYRFATISNVTFVSSNVFVGFWDPFASLSSNNVINFGLVDNVRVESPAYMPFFTLQPAAQTVPLGTNVTFIAAATGLPAPTYQWQLNGTNIPGATNASYPIAFVTATNTGNYSVIATNFMGTVTSTNALLALVVPSAAQFSSITVDGNGSVQLNFTGDSYWTYTIEVSTNLASWNIFTNVTSPNGMFNVTAGSVTGAPQQFFRARVGP